MGGTVEYLAPEAVGDMAGQNSSDPVLLQENQDAYALGVVLYQVLARDPQTPFAMQVSDLLVPERLGWSVPGSCPGGASTPMLHTGWFSFLRWPEETKSLTVTRHSCGSNFSMTQESNPGACLPPHSVADGVLAGLFLQFALHI